MYLINYSSILVIVTLVFLISVIVFLLSFILFYQNINDEKNSIYECGFVPFGDARSKFEVKFYLVSILFIVFDLEITFLIPCVAVLYKLAF
jgi:NADH-quinone oxidoreductase subunit A